jgi:TM2 domain-containing membrane protein YozV
MEQSKVDMFVSANSKNFPAEKLMLIKSTLEGLDESKLTAIQAIPYKNPTTILILAIFFGGLGIDRFMLGDAGLGVVKLITCGGLGIWALIDWFTATSRAREYNYKKFSEAIR